MPNDLITIERELSLPERVAAFSDVLGSLMPPARLIRTILVSIERTPKLLQCSQQSVMNAAMTAAVLGLEVDGVTGQAYLIPYGNNAQLVIGFKGYNSLAARAGMTVSGEVVRDGDFFEYDLGEGYVSHKPSLEPTTGRRIVAAWAKAAARDRPPVVSLLSIHEIEDIKAKSPGAKKNDSPWNDPKIGFPAMASKSAKRRLARSMPLSVFQRGAALDEAVEERGKHAWLRPDGMMQIEGEGIVPAEPSPTPEAATLLAKETPAEALERLEDIARADGMTKLAEAWTLLPTRLQNSLKGEKDRLKEIAEGKSP